LLFSIRALLALPEIQLLMIVLHPEDKRWQHTQILLQPEERARIQTCTGGAQRWQSVQAGLSALMSTVFIERAAQADDWVVVHDAVRPCVRAEDLQALLGACVSDKTCSYDVYVDGALLASPVSDTLKKADSSLNVISTVDRSDLWVACTPQMFPIGALHQALARAANAGISITDEASAMELCGAHPKLVPCAKDNIKITYPEDINLATWILRARVEHTSLPQTNTTTR
jgi:2-C-methyl-D-erythritol 4-phosphate cytidylyltransferase